MFKNILNMNKENIDFIINSLRRATTTWPGRTECLNRGRRKRVIGKMKNGQDKFVWENCCEKCHVWQDQRKNAFEVDHIVEIGPFNGNFHEYILRVFCEQSNLQRLCVSCHSRKTSAFNSTLKYKRKSFVPLLEDTDPLDYL